MSAIGLLLACVGIVILILIDITHYEKRERHAKRMEGTCGGYVAPSAPLPPPHPMNRRNSGRVRLVPPVLLAGIAFLAWLCRDLIWLVWAMFTTTVH